MRRLKYLLRKRLRRLRRQRRPAMMSFALPISTQAKINSCGRGDDVLMLLGIILLIILIIEGMGDAGRH